MKLFHYHDLDYSSLSARYERIFNHLSQGNFSALDIKKIPEAGLYRVKLDYENRLLFRLGRYKGEMCLMLLEAIYQHDYSASRFLRGKALDENRLIPVTSPANATDIMELSYLHTARTGFHYLDKIISFDDHQREIFAMLPPLIIIGSAGSGKTALTLEKIKTLKGNILYITLSPYLVQNSVKIYYSENYENEEQEIDFLSYKEFLETIQILKGREIDFRTFEEWFFRHRNTVKINNAHKLFEEFKGVITGYPVDKAYLTKEEYCSLGVRQSVFPGEEREQVYMLFEKYSSFLEDNNYYDLNIISHRWLPLCEPRYDFIIIDEVQDITNVQLHLILRSLKKPGHFILCGDSNQIVHPNFFSWANVKTLFYKNNELANNTIKVLHTNYRNSPQITGIANRLLKIKNARFGSIDKESSYLVHSISARTGEVMLLADNTKNRTELDNKTKASTHFAVIVMRNEDKAQVRNIFRTPLLFSIHEAKGLEYENVILVNFVSNYDKEFREITDGVELADIEADEISYSRAKDKTDKSLDVYKFYINSFYVAITRSVQNLYLLEASPRHKVLEMLQLTDVKEQINLKAQASSMDEWKREALRLEQQGKSEQAEAIRKTVLGGTQKTPWEPLTLDNIEELKREALNIDNFNKKAKDRLFDYALLNNDEEMSYLLQNAGYKRAEKFKEERNSVFRKYYSNYLSDNVKAALNEANKYGADYRDYFNLTPLMAAVVTGAEKIAKELLAAGANPAIIDNFGRNALQSALFQCSFSMPYTANKVRVIYPLVVTDNIKVKVDNRLLKINNHTIEYFILNYLIAIQSSILNQKRVFQPKGIRMDDLLEKFSAFPENVLFGYRKERTYLSAHFSKNELLREAPDNRKLYKRVERGHYILNPALEINLNDTWVNVYELMKADKIKKDENLALLRERAELYERRIKKLMEERSRVDFDRYSSNYANQLGKELEMIQRNYTEVKNELAKLLKAKEKAVLSSAD